MGLSGVGWDYFPKKLNIFLFGYRGGFGCLFNQTNCINNQTKSSVIKTNWVFGYRGKLSVRLSRPAFWCFDNWTLSYRGTTATYVIMTKLSLTDSLRYILESRMLRKSFKICVSSCVKSAPDAAARGAVAPLDDVGEETQCDSDHRSPELTLDLDPNPGWFVVGFPEMSWHQ